jgi:hypothetical protein
MTKWRSYVECENKEGTPSIFLRLRIMRLLSRAQCLEYNFDREHHQCTRRGVMYAALEMVVNTLGSFQVAPG